MAKSKSKTVARRRKARDAKRAERAAGKVDRIVVSPGKSRVPLEFILRNGAGKHGNDKKAANKAACRKKVKDDE